MEPGDEGFGASREQETKGEANEFIKRTKAAETRDLLPFSSVRT